jgi:hypothetical protein
VASTGLGFSWLLSSCWRASRSVYEVLSGWQEERATWSAGINLHDFLIGAATFPQFWLFVVGPRLSRFSSRLSSMASAAR